MRAAIWAQLLATAAAIGLFALYACRRFARHVALASVVALALLPSNLRFTQVDAVIFATGVFIAAMTLRYLDREALGDCRLVDVVIVHGAFALYYALRNDVLLGWAAVSLVLHR